MSILCSPGLPVGYLSWNRIEEGLDAVLPGLPLPAPVDPAEESHRPVQNHDLYPADAEYAHGFPEYCQDFSKPAHGDVFFRARSLCSLKTPRRLPLYPVHPVEKLIN